MSVLVFAGCAVLFWGGYVFGHNPASNYPRAMRDYYCADENIGKVTDGLWEPWFVLLALGLAGLVTWRQHGPRDRWLEVSAILGMIAIVVACPVTVWFTQVADCGM